MKHSFIDRYGDLDSPLHLLDARSKILGFAALIVTILWTPAGWGFHFFMYFFLIAILMGISQIPLAYIVTRTLVILPFALLAGIARPWTGGFDFTWFYALLMRSVLSLALLILLTNTTRFSELLKGLRKLGMPRILAVNLSFLYRYLFVLLDEIMRMRQARDCRRAGRAGLLTELKTLGSMLGTLMVRSFERAERVYQAMLSRGFTGDLAVPFPRSFGWRDLAFLSGLGLFIAASFTL